MFFKRNKNGTEEVMMKIELFYITSPPTRWTFEPPQVRKFIIENLKGKVLNLFAGQTKLKESYIYNKKTFRGYPGEIVRNDIDPKIDADLHIDAMEIHKHFEKNTFDTVILDPPWNIRKAREKYEGKYMGRYKIVKQNILKIMKQDARVISCGFDSTGMSKSRGFIKTKILLVNHGGE